MKTNPVGLNSDWAIAAINAESKSDCQLNLYVELTMLNCIGHLVHVRVADRNVFTTAFTADEHCLEENDTNSLYYLIFSYNIMVVLF